MVRRTPHLGQRGNHCRAIGHGRRVHPWPSLDRSCVRHSGHPRSAAEPRHLGCDDLRRHGHIRERRQRQPARWPKSDGTHSHRCARFAGSTRAGAVGVRNLCRQRDRSALSRLRQRCADGLARCRTRSSPLVPLRDPRGRWPGAAGGDLSRRRPAGATDRTPGSSTGPPRTHGDHPADRRHRADRAGVLRVVRSRLGAAMAVRSAPVRRSGRNDPSGDRIQRGGIVVGGRRSGRRHGERT